MVEISASSWAPVLCRIRHAGPRRILKTTKEKSSSPDVVTAAAAAAAEVTLMQGL